MLKKIKSWKAKITNYIKGNETEEIFFVETRFEDRIIRCRMKYGEVISMPVGGIKIQKKQNNLVKNSHSFVRVFFKAL